MNEFARIPHDVIAHILGYLSAHQVFTQVRLVSQDLKAATNKPCASVAIIARTAHRIRQRECTFVVKQPPRVDSGYQPDTLVANAVVPMAANGLWKAVIPEGSWKTIVLRHVRLTGTCIPDGVRHLDLSHNWIEHEDQLQLPITLQTLALADNDLTRCPMLPSLIHLQHLDLSENGLKEVRTQWPASLLSLNLSRNHLRSVTDLPSSLSTLLLHDNDRPLEHLVLPAQLRTLDLSGNRISNVELPSSLTHLKLRSCSLDDSWIQVLSQLVHLVYLCIDDNLFETFPSHMTSLRRLEARYNPFQSMPQLTSFPQLEECCFLLQDIQHIRDHPTLRFPDRVWNVSFGSDKFIPPVPRHRFSPMGGQVTRLNVTGCAIDAQMLRLLFDAWPNLKHLNASGTPIHEDPPKHHYDVWPSLTTLVLDHMPPSDLLLRIPWRFLQQTQVSLEGTSIPEGWTPQS